MGIVYSEFWRTENGKDQWVGKDISRLETSVVHEWRLEMGLVRWLPSWIWQKGGVENQVRKDRKRWKQEFLSGCATGFGGWMGLCCLEDFASKVISAPWHFDQLKRILKIFSNPSWGQQYQPCRKMTEGSLGSKSGGSPWWKWWVSTKTVLTRARASETALGFRTVIWGESARKERDNQVSLFQWSQRRVNVDLGCSGSHHFHAWKH